MVWSVGVTLAGYALGSTIPGIDTYLLPIIAVIVIASFIPIGLELLRTRAAARASAGAASDAGGPGQGAGRPVTLWRPVAVDLVESP